MITIQELLDLDKTIAAELFAGKTYPWEVLDEIKPFILKLGETLSPEEFDHPSEGVWIDKDLHHRPRRGGAPLRLYPR